MGKTCTKNTLKINEYLDKEIELKKRGLAYFDGELERHLEECDSCRREMTEQRQLFAELSSLEQFHPPADFTANLMAMLPRQAANPFPLWGILAGIVGLALSVVMLLAVSFWLLGSFDITGLLKTLIDSISAQGWEIGRLIFDGAVNLVSIMAGVLKAIWALAEAYPLHFLTMALVAVFLFLVLARLINSFQRENYA